MINFILTILPLIISIAYFTLFERKIMASIQRRNGPTVVGYLGLLQPLADGFKLLFKEIVLPSKVNFIIFIGSPLITFFSSLLNWSIVPFSYLDTINNINLSCLLFLSILSIGIYGIFWAGWSSNSKFSLLGSIRSIAQMISYEIIFSICILNVALLSGSLNFFDIVYVQGKSVWFIFPLLPISIIFFISILAETNRTPFDLAEAEAELVAGYNLEYSSIIFALFFLGEYSNIILMSIVFSIFFLGGWSSAWLLPCAGISVISLKTLFICFMFILIRSILPRFRYDQLMFLCWKRLMPISFSYFLFIYSLLLTVDSLLFN
jgi:NADH-quinone oxidoreductase subunit H